MLLHEGDGFLGHAVFDVLVGRVGIGIEVRELPRRDVAAGRPGPGPVRHIHVEAVLQRRIGLGAEMPFAEMAGGVAGVLQRLRQRVVVGLQPRDAGGRDRLFAGRCASGAVASSTTCGRWQFGVVMPVRAGLRPVRIAERVGEQSGLAE